MALALRPLTQFRPQSTLSLPDDFAQRMQGQRIIALERRAKYILARLDDDQIWVTHLGMTGRFLSQSINDPSLYHAKPGDHKHRHLNIVVNNGSVASIDYIDPRRFGFMWLIESKALDEQAWYKTLGPEPLSNEFHADQLKHVLQTRQSSIKSALMDQSVVAGLGNIYVCEASMKLPLALYAPVLRYLWTKRKRLCAPFGAS